MKLHVITWSGLVAVDVLRGTAEVSTAEEQAELTQHVSSIEDQDQVSPALDLLLTDPAFRHVPVIVRADATGTRCWDPHRRCWVGVSPERLLRSIENRWESEQIGLDPRGVEGWVEEADEDAVSRRALQRVISLPQSPRPSVWAVDHTEVPHPNLALGTLLATAAEMPPEDAQQWAFRPLGVAKPSTLDSILDRHGAAVFLFSNYMWSDEANLELSRRVKERSPNSLTVHGGPSVPKYEGDAESWFERHRHVDVAVRGEGEQTFTELMRVLGGDLSIQHRHALTQIPGLTVRLGDEIVRTADRDRITDLEEIASPYLAGLFDDIPAEQKLMMVVETNRGCPYGCVFCDWGAATNTRIRQFDLERVLNEIDWAGRNKVQTIYIADANFGIFKRDIEIVQALCEAKRRYGYPEEAHFTFAKNTVRHLLPIMETLFENNIVVDANVAFQTVDPPTLQTIRRKNLPDRSYRDLRDLFRKKRIPLITDMMFGLPGSTRQSMINDLQFCFDHELSPTVHHVTVLPNAPMNDPDFRRHHTLTLGSLNQVISSDTFTERDVTFAFNTLRLLDAFDRMGLLRHVLRFVQLEHGVLATDFLQRIDAMTRSTPDKYPSLSWCAVAFGAYHVPYTDWLELMADTRSFLRDEFHIDADRALDTVLELQAALLPNPHARYPIELQLAHDYSAWYWDHLGSTTLTKPLSTYGNGTVTIRDPSGKRLSSLRANIDVDPRSKPYRLRSLKKICGEDWELSYGFERPGTKDYRQPAFKPR